MSDSMVIYELSPDPLCPYCHGSGIVTDWVPMPFGTGSCGMDSPCECVTDGLTEEQWVEIDAGRADWILVLPSEEE